MLEAVDEQVQPLIDISLFDELFRDFERLAGQTYNQLDYNLSFKLNKNPAGKLCAPIFIDS